MKEPTQKDEPYLQNNKVILKQIMDLLYETYITEDETAKYRGIAIQAVNKMLEDLNVLGVIEAIEEKPYSQRRRESLVWNEPEIAKPLNDQPNIAFEKAKEYCEKVEFICNLGGGDPKATIFNMRSMAYTAGYKQALEDLKN